MTGRNGRQPTGWGPRLFARPSGWAHSVAGQVFALMAVIVLLLIGAGAVALVVQSRYDSERDARNRSLAAAEAFAHAPGLPAALKAANPTAELQPLADAARRGSGIDFIAVMNLDGVRYTDSRPELIGKRATGDLSRALAGHSFTETFLGEPSDAVRAVVPVRDADGAVIGLVGTGIEVANVADAVEAQSRSSSAPRRPPCCSARAAPSWSADGCSARPTAWAPPRWRG